MAGPSIALTLSANGGAWRVQMTSENLIRALVNLVKNASESIEDKGAIHLEPRASGAIAPAARGPWFFPSKTAAGASPAT